MGLSRTVCRFFLAACCLSAFLALGCKTPQATSASPAALPSGMTASKNEIKQEVANIDRKIDKLHDDIQFNRDFINTETLAMIDAMGNAGAKTTRGGLNFRDNPYEDAAGIITRANLNIRAAEKDIARKEQQIEKMIAEKSRLLNQEKKSCFPADILVQMGDGSFKPISEVHTGETVMTFDIGERADKPFMVKETYRDENNHYYTINHRIQTTAFERFLTPGGWKKTMLLKVGDMIQCQDGWTRIESLEITSIRLPVYNLHVASAHTFYVSADGENSYLVHNTGGGGGGDGGK